MLREASRNAKEKKVTSFLIDQLINCSGMLLFVRPVLVGAGASASRQKQKPPKSARHRSGWLAGGQVQLHLVGANAKAILRRMWHGHAWPPE